jgi:hypothetical protein
MRRIRLHLTALVVLSLALLSSAVKADEPKYRPPAVPLVVENPFFNIWSCADNLTDDVTRHWTHRAHSLDSVIRIDGQSFRLMGNQPQDTPPLKQVNLRVLPTRTAYDFQGAGVHVTLTFTTPMLPTDVEVLSRPLTYLTWDVKAIDGKPHTVSVLFSASGELAVNSTDQKVGWGRPQANGLAVMKMGTPEQPYVIRNGDDSRIDWGYAYVAAPANESTGAIGSEKTLLQSFIDSGKLPTTDDTDQPREVRNDLPTMALVMDFGTVSNRADVEATRHAMIAYDDVYAVDFFGEKLPGIWRKPDMSGEKLLEQGEAQYPQLTARCQAFDNELMADLTKVGGEDYAYMCALAYRQAIGACGTVDDRHGQPFIFPKECTSNGNMATVDVIFPMDPILLLLSPTLAKASLAPVFVYAASPRWKWPNAPHDLGEYPICFGRDDGGEAMPVEESGNMIILADAICQIDGNTKFVDAWWPQISQWAKYLEQYGLDPAEQLCTDDFKGRLAHNANLSVKAIVALAAYGDMCRIKGETSTASRYLGIAKADAKHWIEADSEGDHFKLAFNKPNTWGQNYNMVWDSILGLNVFPADVKKKQIEFFKTKMQPYGLPLDNRNMLTKSDWCMWTASMADNQADFETIINPMIGYLNATNDRTPFADGYWTDSHTRKDFFHARPVIGGVFIRMLTQPAIWKKWASMDKETVGTYAKLPPKAVVTEVVPTSQHLKINWAYTTDKPAEGWMEPDFNAGSWTTGMGGFGHGAPHTNPRSEWSSDDIYLRRQIEIPQVDKADLKFICYHDDDVEIYINGVLAAKAGGYVTNYEPLDINEQGKAALKPGKNLLAVHCHQIRGGQYIDVGIATVKMPPEEK